MATKKVRSDCRFNELEMKEILPYKTPFISGTIPERMTILKEKLLPTLFNYWQEHGKEYDERESKAISKVIQ